MREMTTNVIENKALLLGNNEFETGAVVLDPGQEIKEGAFLKRGDPGLFVPVTNTDNEEPVAIIPVTVKNTRTEPLKMSLRGCISGKVRADMLNLNGTQATTAQIDVLRKFTGMVPIFANDISRTQGGI
jgi:hypothetical protein